jgi:hypothetical protein
LLGRKTDLRRTYMATGQLLGGGGGDAYDPKIQGGGVWQKKSELVTTKITLLLLVLIGMIPFTAKPATGSWQTPNWLRMSIGVEKKIQK